MQTKSQPAPKPAMDCGTCETMPMHFWLHEVELTAIRRGADAEAFHDEFVHGKLVLWYRSGEPVWMAADGAYHLARGYVLAKREGGERRAIKRAIAGMFACNKHDAIGTGQGCPLCAEENR